MTTSLKSLSLNTNIKLNQSVNLHKLNPFTSVFHNFFNYFAKHLNVHYFLLTKST